MNRVVPEFLAQADGLERHGNCILLLGATNRPWDMDEAALRGGRFGEQFYVPLPDTAAREQILRLNLDGIPREPGVDLHRFAVALEGYSGADIATLCVRATDYPFQRQIATGEDALVLEQDLQGALRAVKPSVTTEMLDRYRRFAEGSSR
jgi:SpoVK/Ycf46/Vps4 family AAA+-type ATPase